MFGAKLKPDQLLAILGGKEKALKMLVPMLSGIEPKLAEKLISKGEELKEDLFAGMLVVPAVKGDIKKVAMLEVSLLHTDEGIKIVEVLGQSNFSKFIGKSLIPSDEG